MAAQPKYLTGDGQAIKEFIDQFDVRNSIRCRLRVLTIVSGLLIRLRWLATEPLFTFFKAAFLTENLGVLWSGDYVYEGIPETLQLLRSKGTHP